MLSDYVAQTRTDPFEWGRNDCALWCASAVQYGTGFDPAADLRGAYSSWFECRQIVQRAGGLVSLIAPRMAWPALRPLDGDGVAVLRVDGRQMCGLIIDRRAVLRLERGLRLVDEFQVLRGWSWSQH